MNWLRLYTDILDDEKISKLSDNQYRIFTYLMLVACEKEENGSFQFNTKDLSWRLRLPEKQINNTIEVLSSLNIISIKNNTLAFNNWTKRQYKSDDVTARVKRFRGKKETLHETLENRTDTEQIQNRTEEKPLHCNADVFVLPEWIPKETWVEYLKTRKKKKAAETPYALNLVVSELLKIKEAHNQDPIEVLNKSIKSGWIDVYPLKSNNGNGNGNTPAREPPPLIVSCPVCGGRVTRSDLTQTGCVNCRDRVAL